MVSVTMMQIGQIEKRNKQRSMMPQKKIGQLRLLRRLKIQLNTVFDKQQYPCIKFLSFSSDLVL